MNHRTPIEDFRARLAALSREQLEEAMHYLRGYDSFAMDRALELAEMPVTNAAAAAVVAEAIRTGTPVIVEDDAADRCPDCGRASCTGEDCYWPDEAGIRRPARDEPGTIAGDFGPETVNGGAK
jgi:hypothetical protein